MDEKTRSSLRMMSGFFRRKYYRKKVKAEEKKLLNGLKEDDKKSWLWEFSKRILFMLTILYCTERVYAMFMMVYMADFSYLGTFLETGADVFKAGVIFYAVKAGLENVAKIYKQNESQVMPDGED